MKTKTKKPSTAKIEVEPKVDSEPKKEPLQDVRVLANSVGHEVEPDPVSKVDAIAAEFEANYQQAEAILRRCFVVGTQPTFAESSFFATVLGWDDIEQRKQAARVGRVVKTQLIAGESADRQALSDALVEAKKHTEVRGAELQETIAAAQKELHSIERDERQLEKRNAEVEQALRHLSDSVPDHVYDLYNRKKRHIKSTLGTQVHELKAEILHHECLIDPKRHKKQIDYVTQVQRFDRSVVVDESKKRGWRELKILPEWEAKRQALEAGLPAKKTELARLEAELERELEQLRNILEHYWR